MQETLTAQDFKIMRKAGKVAAAVLRKLKRFIKPGISSKDIENFFEQYIKKYPGMEAAFKGFSGYPASVCVSINEEIIHGIPGSQKIINDGDVVSVDLGIKYQGLFVDTAYTYPVGDISPLAKTLIKVTEQALYLGIKQAKPGNRIGDIGSAVQKYVERHGFSVIRRFVGHGIGKDLHLSPEVPNFGTAGDGPELFPGTAIAIEPMVAVGGYPVRILNDGWTAVTQDGSLAAHFEHTLAITERGPWIITK